jgi:hypothetical protein
MTKVEEVARAIEGALPNQMKHLGPLLARAAIEAMREPTDTMVFDVMVGAECSRNAALMVWEVSIKAALSE